MKITKRIISKEVYEISTPDSVYFGDPGSAGETAAPKSLFEKNASFFYRNWFPKTYASFIVLEKSQQIITNRLFIPSFTLSIYICHKDYIDSYLDGMFFPSAVKDNGDITLLTKSERYEMRIKQKDSDAVCRQVFPVGFNGNYGHVFDCIRPHGCQITLELPDESLLPDTQVREMLAELFHCPAIIPDTLPGSCG